MLEPKDSNDAASAHIEEGIRIKPVNVELEEEGVRIALTIVDTPGFGDNIDNSDSCVLLSINMEQTALTVRSASKRSLATSNVSTMTSSLWSRVSSVTHASLTTVFTPSSTLSLPLAMRKSYVKASSLTY